jgi:2-polyprenyl-6-methoxyphenol hydroxylase-like FAD-dependent oxidoreductase
MEVREADAVISGGGPNGLLLASELRLGGIRPVVLERLPERSRVPRANGLVGRVTQALDHRGLHEPLAGRPGPPVPVPFFTFGGLPLDLRDLDPDPSPLHTLAVPQTRIEQVLEERALELGAEIRRGHELIAFTQDETAVTLDVRGPDGDAYRLRTRYLVGADGGHSLVRKQAGIAFPGLTDDSFTSRAAHAVLPDATLAELEARDLRPFTHNRLPGGAFTYAPLGPPGVHIVSAMEWHRPPVPDTVPMTFAELHDTVRRVLGTDLALSEPPAAPGPRLLRRVTGVSSRQAETYRCGRVLLLGDAAYVHSAMGGPGLNLGLQDALNLGWKLAAQVRGWAPPGLLDTYESERAPVSSRVLMHTRAQMALMAPGDHVTAVRELFAELLGDAAARRRIAGLLSGADTAYAPWAAELPLPGLLLAARPVLLDATGEGAMAARAARWKDRVDLVEAPAQAPAGEGGPAALLVRPDGYVAYAGESPDDLRAALADWFGAPMA